MPDSRPYSDSNGHLAMEVVIERIVAECPDLAPILKADEDVVGGLPCLQISWIAKALVRFGQDGNTNCLRPVLGIAEEVLAGFDQEGRDFIGACFVEGIPEGGEAVLAPFAGPLLLRAMGPYLDPTGEVKTLQLLWLDNWWDGPLSGVVVHGAMQHRFGAVWDPRTDDWSTPRVFWLFEPMTHDEREQAWERHRFFEDKVGTVYCFHPGVERGIERPRATHHEFYDRFPPKKGRGLDYPRAIGWFNEQALGDFRPKRSSGSKSS